MAGGLLTRKWFHGLMAVLILGLDLLTGPYLQFPILFVLPVTLSAWFGVSRFAYALAVLLPIGRFLIAEFVDRIQPTADSVVNALVRIAVLGMLAYLVRRTARQTKELEEKVSGLAKICAWSRTIEHEGEWISFEEYLWRRFRINTTHGISPAEVRKIFGETTPDAPSESGGRPQDSEEP